MTASLTDEQLDALRELANIASGTAATALAQMLGREVEINVPRALALSPADAVQACGDPEQPMSAVVIPVEGRLKALVLLLVSIEDSARLCRLLDTEPCSEVGDSALREIGNILGTTYLNVFASMTGLELLPCPPLLERDLLAAIIAGLLAETVDGDGLALMLDSELLVASEPCSMSFLLLPPPGGVSELLAPFGLGEMIR